MQVRAATALQAVEQAGDSATQATAITLAGRIQIPQAQAAVIHQAVAPVGDKAGLQGESNYYFGESPSQRKALRGFLLQHAIF